MKLLLNNKEILKFLADVLYVKGIICYEEYEDILDVSGGDGLEEIIEKMLNDGYNIYRRGECYVQYKYPNQSFPDGE